MTVALLPQPFRKLFQFCAKLLLRGPTLYLEVAVARLPAVMRESQKVECLRLSSSLLGIPFGKPSELDQFRLAWLCLQVESFQPLLHLSQKPLGFLLILKARQIVIRVPKVVSLSFTALLESSLEPQVQRIVEINIGQQRTQASP